MNTKLTSIAVITASLALTGCLEVEDNNSNAELAQAIQDQNDILEQQSQNEAVLNLTGQISVSATNSNVSSASVLLKYGNTQMEAVSVDADGRFQISDVPFISDYVIVVSSSDDSFMTRAFYGSSRSSEGASGEVFEDVGALTVDDGEVFQFAFVNNDTSESVNGLSLYTYSHKVHPSRQSTVNTAMDYASKSTYDESTGLYSIELPSTDSAVLWGSTDVDKDGRNDFSTVAYGLWAYSSLTGTYQFRANREQFEAINTVYLKDLADPDALAKNVQVRLSVLNDDVETFSDLEVVINDSLNGKVVATYDTDSQQYVLDAKLKQEVAILVPSFVRDGVSYGSRKVTIRDTGDGLEIFTVVKTAYGFTNKYYGVDSDSETIDVVVALEEATAETELSVVYNKEKVGKDHKHSVFYSGAVGVDTESTRLIKQGHISVIKGNAVNDDLVLPGATYIISEELDVEHNADLTLNNTRLTLSPKSTLESGYSYRYEVGTLQDLAADNEIALYNDSSQSFYVSPVSSQAFTINDLVIDNNNNTTDGNTIVTENTAGQNSSSTNYSRSAQLFFPLGIENSLKNLVLKRTAITQNGNAQLDNDYFKIIENGQLVQNNTVMTISLAENENVQYIDTYSNYYYRGTSLPDGKYLVMNLYTYLADNTAGSENSMTFEYSYETYDGAVEAGQITLNVN